MRNECLFSFSSLVLSVFLVLFMVDEAHTRMMPVDETLTTKPINGYSFLQPLARIIDLLQSDEESQELTRAVQQLVEEFQTCQEQIKSLPGIDLTHKQQRQKYTELQKAVALKQYVYIHAIPLIRSSLCCT
jgi:hypothetical protein